MQFKVAMIGKASLFVCAFSLSLSAISADLSVEKKNYSTRLIVKVKSPQTFVKERLPVGVKEISYRSGDLVLKAWISLPFGKHEKNPAVVFLHGGFSFSKEDWDAAQAFVSAGYILMMPMLRGENGGKGYFEMFGGEVDDAIAAGKYLASLDSVDPNRVFVSGHSVGASIAVLVSAMESPFKASAAFSAYPKLLDWIDDFAELAPFELSLERERRIRDPYLYLSNFKIPIYLTSEAEKLQNISTNKEFCGLVKKFSFCLHHIVKGDHQSMLSPSTRNSIIFFDRYGKE